MKNIFGFGISPSSTVNMDKVDFTLFDRLHELEPDAWKCMSCGSYLQRNEPEEGAPLPPARQGERGRENAPVLHALREMLHGLPPRHQHQTSDTLNLQTV